PGAALWQLVRFAGGVDGERAAAIEGALYGAGLLTAWVHPDPALTRAAVDAAEADGYLLATAPVTGPSLADVLVPEEQDHVPAAVIAAVLRSVALRPAAVAVQVEAGSGEAAAERAAGPVSISELVSVTENAQFRLGPQVGARPKPAPEFIGATNRATRRRARLTAAGELIDRAAGRELQLARRLERAAALLADFGRARRELPATRPVAQAAEAVSRHAALLARARAETAGARTAVDRVIADLEARGRQLRTAAAERRLPAAGDEVDAIARAVAEFETAAAALYGERATLARAEEDLGERAAAIGQARAGYAEAEAACEEAQRLQEAQAEELRAREEALSADGRRVLTEISAAERGIAAAQRAYDDLDRAARAEHDKATRAQASLDGARRSLADAVAALHEQAAGFAELARPDLRSLIGVGSPAGGGALPHWPDAAAWPDPARASAELAALLERDAGPRDDTARDDTARDDTATLVRQALPAGVAEILGAYSAATTGAATAGAATTSAIARGTRPAADGTLKNASDRMSAALKDFEQALEACDEHYRVDWEPGRGGIYLVSVLDDEGRQPVAGFATRIGERAQDQGVLLADRERAVLEDELLAGLARQIHARALAARDLTRDMDADTRAKPMSSGITIGIRWAQSDKITDRQREAVQLLERDAPGPERLARLRGLLREMIREYRGAHPRATYREALRNVLDYRSWHAFELTQQVPGEPETRLTRARHSVMSGGEKSASIHLPLFAAAGALYSSASGHCPRLIALDEAFVGIDERYKPDLFGLAVKFSLDLFMTGHDLWVTCDTVPMIAHYDMYHDKTSRTVSSLLVLWDGAALIDASAGFRDNEALATELLGFRPSRHAPLGTGATLDSEAPGSGLSDDEDEED
ncbi:MAG TPA: SbcC/MukB-like Walker B domain-containing protein, partial [Trebonia sp.]|nr:SbcC/MukB-like Walker B domain-containing protein [Trebonia sp.]